MKKNLNIQIQNKIATLQNEEDGKRPFIVCGNSDYTITFHFDEEWDINEAKTARFVYKQNEKVKAENIPFTGDTVEVPKLLKITWVSVGVFAGDLYTTTPAVIVCLPSILCDGDLVPDPDPNVYNELMELINGLVIKGVPDEKIMEAVNQYLSENGLDVLPAVTEDDNGKVLQVEGGEWTAKELPENGGEDIPNVFPWAKQELFSKEDLVDPAGRNSFIEIDGVEYYRYHCSTSNFVWNNPKPYPGAVTITARAVAQYGGTGGTRLLTIYDDGTYGPILYVIVGGESRTVTVTTDANKTLAKITGNYDMENWALLDMSVMSCIADYNIGLPLANEYVPGGVVADPVQDGDTKPVRIGADGRLYTEPDGAVPDEKITEAVNQYLDENGVKSLPDVTEADNGKALQVDNGKWVAKELPESGGSVSGDYIPVPSTAEVGQTIVVKSVDENGKPTDWETADMVSGSDGWTDIGEITLDGAEFIISAYSDGVVTIIPENGVYPPVNRNTVLRKPDYSAYSNVKFIATETDGQYTMINLDGAVYAPSDDMTQYIIDVPSASFLSFANIPEFSFFKAKITTPLLCVHGSRSMITSSYPPFYTIGYYCSALSGGVAEEVLETENSPIAGKIYSKGSFKGKNANRVNGYDVIQIVDQPKVPKNISFSHFNGLLTIGTTVKLWGRN